MDAQDYMTERGEESFAPINCPRGRDVQRRYDLHADEGHPREVFDLPHRRFFDLVGGN